MAVVAAACVRPTTFGMATGGGPDETTSATALPAATDVPAIGVWLITGPRDRGARRGGDGADRETGARDRRRGRRLRHADDVGVATGGGPDETTSATALPVATCAPATGVD